MYKLQTTGPVRAAGAAAGRGRGQAGQGGGDMVKILRTDKHDTLYVRINCIPIYKEAARIGVGAPDPKPKTVRKPASLI